MKKVFISYSSKDYKWLEQLEKHLSSSTVRLWADVNIRPGEDWSQSVKDSIEESNFAIVLISPDYLSSRMVDNELRIIFERSKQGKLHILPVIASSGDVSFKAEVDRIFEGHPLISNNSLSADDSGSIYQIISERINPVSNTPSKSGNSISNLIDWFSRSVKPARDERPMEGNTTNKRSDLQKNIFFEIEEKIAQQEQEKLTRQHD
jgi:TIR domain